jgi:hypothetical protein
MSQPPQSQMSANGPFPLRTRPWEAEGVAGIAELVLGAAPHPAGLVLLALSSTFATPAAARIVCHGDFQIVEGNEISTPYCSDRHIARAAERRGSKISANQVRNSPEIKSELCRNDIGLEDSCAPSGDNE